MQLGATGIAEPCGLACDAVGHQLWTISQDVDALEPSIYALDRTTGQATQVGTGPSGVERVCGVTYDSGTDQMLGLSLESDEDRLWSTSTEGTATALGSTGIGTGCGLVHIPGVVPPPTTTTTTSTTTTVPTTTPTTTTTAAAQPQRLAPSFTG